MTESVSLALPALLMGLFSVLIAFFLWKTLKGGGGE